MRLTHWGPPSWNNNGTPSPFPSQLSLNIQISHQQLSKVEKYSFKAVFFINKHSRDTVEQQFPGVSHNDYWHVMWGETETKGSNQLATCPTAHSTATRDNNFTALNMSLNVLLNKMIHHFICFSGSVSAAKVLTHSLGGRSFPGHTPWMKVCWKDIGCKNYSNLIRKGSITQKCQFKRSI